MSSVNTIDIDYFISNSYDMACYICKTHMGRQEYGNTTAGSYRGMSIIMCSDCVTAMTRSARDRELAKKVR